MELKGFTLLELLIVIGILAILGTTTILVINPAQMLAEARDTQRISDLRAVQRAINLYLSSNTSTITTLSGDNTPCPDTPTAWRASQSALGSTLQPFVNPATPVSSATISNLRAIDGTGWVSVRLNQTSGGSPLGNLPQDPRVQTASHTKLNADGRWYAYICSGLTYEINANMESVRYSNGGTSDVESTDGGLLARDGATTTLAIANAIYEVGNDPGLDL